MEVKFTHLHNTASQYHKSFANVFFIFQLIILSLSSAFREIIADVFPLYTDISFHLLWHWSSSTSGNKMIIQLV